MGTITVTTTEHDFAPMHDRMQWYVDQDILSCVATVIMRGTDVIDHATFGYLDLESRQGLPEDAIFRMYSNTKIVTSVAAMQLREQGAFDLDDPLSAHLPGFDDMQVLRPDATSADDTEPAREPIRVRHVLSHSAGFSYGFIEPDSVVDQAYAAAGVSLFAGVGFDLAGLCDLLADLPLAYHPGTGWRYSVATDVTARLVEVWSGKAFDEYLRANIFDPLGMADTDFWVPEDKRDRFTAMYSPVNFFDPMEGGLTLADDPHSGTYTSKPRFLSGGGGLVSTVDDYLTFLRMIVNGGTWDGERIIGEDSLEQMRTNQLAPGVNVRFPMWDMPGTTFGLGFALKEELSEDDPAGMQDEYHWGGMAGTHSWMSPRTGLTGFCLTQRMPGFWHPHSHEFKRLTYDIAAS